MKLASLPVLALAMALGACQDAGRPEALIGPSSGPARHIEGTDGKRYEAVRENYPVIGTAIGIIGPEGGRLVLGRHSLEVPAGAVSAPTTFKMIKLDDELQFKLTATQLLLNDVGARGFAAPVRLVINYGYAKDYIADPSALRIGWVKSSDTIEIQPGTSIDVTGKRAIGLLTHFSDYMLAVP